MPRAGLLGHRLRLGQLGLAAVATILLLCSSNTTIYKSYLLPAAALQCASAAAVAVVSTAHGRPTPRAAWGTVFVDGVTATATFAAGSGVRGVAVLCAGEPGLCADVVAGSATKAVLAWALLQGPAALLFTDELYQLASGRGHAVAR